MSERHGTLEEFCKTVCTGKLGWNRKRRKECRNNTMCQECKRLIDTANKKQNKRPNMSDAADQKCQFVIDGPDRALRNRNEESWFYDQMFSAAKAAVGKKAIDLTPLERFAVAIVGGAKLAKSQLIDGHLYLTTEPCSVVDSGDGHFLVVVKAVDVADNIRHMKFTD